VRRVEGLQSGVYHYASDVHRLERLPAASPVPPFDELLPTQWWYREAGALVLLTAVFERTRWRYEGPRAYRAVLIEAGHACQTFCLTATWLGLAPFCSMALADSAIENMLGLDGVSESVLYAAGIGSRPARSSLPPGAVPTESREGS
jgi:SagB-type dehydrogenase family enzyme